MWLPLLEGSLAFRLGRWLRKREILLTNKFCISTEWIKSTKSLFSVYDWEAFWFILIVVLGGENFSQNTCPTSCDTYKMFSGNKNKEMLQILEFSHLWMAGSFIFYKNTFIYLFIQKVKWEGGKGGGERDTHTLSLYVSLSLLSPASLPRWRYNSQVWVGCEGLHAGLPN